MDENIRKFFISVAIYITVILVSAGAGYLTATLIHQGELTEVRGDLQSATENSAELREKNLKSSERFREIAELAEERHKKIKRLENTIFEFENSIREREKIIKELSDGLVGAKGDTAEIGKLAKRGRDIVRSILAEGPW